MNLHATAPGKVVLWGEYAVLTGAPALVLAVDRYARCRYSPRPEPGWQFRARGFAAADETVSLERLLAPEPPAADSAWRLVWQALQALPGHRLPPGGQLLTDTGPFHEGASKLGLGSSAAACVATYGLLCRLLNEQPTLQTALDLHRALQHGRGSGIDVAAAWHGGALRFERPPGGVLRCRASAVPALPLVFVWSGTSASTTDHLARFREWLQRGQTQPLDRLAACAARLFDSGDLLTDLAHYVTALKSLDRAAELGIYGPGHRRFDALAKRAGVVYKPCGAGGGDIGVAVAPSAALAARFIRLVEESGFLRIRLEISPHGFEAG